MERRGLSSFRSLGFSGRGVGENFLLTLNSALEDFRHELLVSCITNSLNNSRTDFLVPPFIKRGERGDFLSRYRQIPLCPFFKGGSPGKVIQRTSGTGH
jgi:hypothetical protein